MKLLLPPSFREMLISRESLEIVLTVKKARGEISDEIVPGVVERLVYRDRARNRRVFRRLVVGRHVERCAGRQHAENDKAAETRKARHRARRSGNNHQRPPIPKRFVVKAERTTARHDDTSVGTIIKKTDAAIL